MSETISPGIQDDGEPPSARPRYEENYQTGKMYLAEHAEPYRVGELSTFADSMIATYLTTDEIKELRREDEYVRSLGFESDLKYTISNGSARLTRRHSFVVDENNIQHEAVVYYYVEGENDYCRSWISGSERVNWCLDEGRYESAENVQSRIQESLSVSRVPEKTRRKVGSVLNWIQSLRMPSYSS